MVLFQAGAVQWDEDLVQNRSALFLFLLLLPRLARTRAGFPRGVAACLAGSAEEMGEGWQGGPCR